MKILETNKLLSALRTVSCELWILRCIHNSCRRAPYPLIPPHPTLKVLTPNNHIGWFPDPPQPGDVPPPYLLDHHGVSGCSPISFSFYVTSHGLDFKHGLIRVQLPFNVWRALRLQLKAASKLCHEPHPFQASFRNINFHESARNYWH